MPSLEPEYWRLASGPAWCWWVLAILPLDTLAQVQTVMSNLSLSSLKLVKKTKYTSTWIVQ